MVVMPYQSNPCEDFWTKRGRAISCHSASSFSSTLFSKKSTQTQPRLFGSVCPRPAPLRLMKKWGKEGQELILIFKHLQI